jgi:protocatechuate 4,5-dioxygenase beta chain
MAKLVAILATTHHPFFYRTSRLAREDAPPFAAEWISKVTAYRETLTRVRPDLLIMVGSDHFHQLWLDNMPQFLIGKAPYYDANWYNEEREFGLPRLTLAGHEELSAYMLREGLDKGFDLAFSNELRVDHSITCPILTLRPENDLPIVPVYTNIFAPPLPRPERFVHSRDGGRLAERATGRRRRHRPPLARTRRPAPVRPARSRSRLRPAGDRVDRRR